jgi:hypothetical protein
MKRFFQVVSRMEIQFFSISTKSELIPDLFNIYYQHSASIFITLKQHMGHVCQSMYVDAYARIHISASQEQHTYV